MYFPGDVTALSLFQHGSTCCLGSGAPWCLYVTFQHAAGAQHPVLLPRSCVCARGRLQRGLPPGNRAKLTGDGVVLPGGFTGRNVMLGFCCEASQSLPLTAGSPPCPAGHQHQAPAHPARSPEGQHSPGRSTLHADLDFYFCSLFSCPGIFSHLNKGSWTRSWPCGGI